MYFLNGPFKTRKYEDCIVLNQKLDKHKISATHCVTSSQELPLCGRAPSNIHAVYWCDYLCKKTNAVIWKLHLQRQKYSQLWFYEHSQIILLDETLLAKIIGRAKFLSLFKKLATFARQSFAW